jgi:hypothetical protein
MGWRYERHWLRVVSPDPCPGQKRSSAKARTWGYFPFCWLGPHTPGTGPGGAEVARRCLLAAPAAKTWGAGECVWGGWGGGAGVPVPQRGSAVPKFARRRKKRGGGWRALVLCLSARGGGKSAVTSSRPTRSQLPAPAETSMLSLQYEIWHHISVCVCGSQLPPSGS